MEIARLVREEPAYDCEFCKEAGYYKQRNCEKFFPDQPNNPKYKWNPDFKTAKGAFFGIATDIDCTDCPVSAISPSSRHLIQIEYQNQILKESTGGSLYGHDLSKWPSKTIDSFTRIASIRNEYLNALHEAQMDESH